MNEQDLELMYDNCIDRNGELNEDKFDDDIEKLNGSRFISLWEDYHRDDAIHPEEDMIEYMKQHGFLVFDDPAIDQYQEATGWVVFPPNTTLPKPDYEKRHLSDVPPESVGIFGYIQYTETQTYYVVYPGKSISKANKIKLKELGWKLEKNSTGKYIWIWDKKFDFGTINEYKKD